MQKVISPNQEDVLISFLPLAHMFERLIEVTLHMRECVFVERVLILFYILMISSIIHSINAQLNVTQFQ